MSIIETQEDLARFKEYRDKAREETPLYTCSECGAKPSDHPGRVFITVTDREDVRVNRSEPWMHTVGYNPSGYMGHAECTEFHSGGTLRNDVDHARGQFCVCWPGCFTKSVERTVGKMGVDRDAYIAGSAKERDAEISSLRAELEALKKDAAC